MRLTILSKCLLVALIATYALSSAPTVRAEREHISKRVYHTEYYVTQPGDTLESIAVRFYGKNTYGPRQFNEFTEGIAETNPQYFMGKNKVVPVGVRLKINYWEE